MEIKIPFKTPTINHLYWHKGNMKIMKTEAKELREKIKNIIITTIDRNTKFIFNNQRLKIIVEIHENWLTKKEEVARKDISNREKFLLDSVFKALGIDDKFIFEHTFLKVQDEKEFALIKLNAL